MRTRITQYFLGQYLGENWWLLGLILLCLLSGIVITLLPIRVITLLVVLTIGLPLVVLIWNKRTRNIAVILTLALLPLTAILKAVTGSRFAPLTFDFALLFACVLNLAEGLIQGKLRIDKLDILLLILWGLAFVQIFNPNVPGIQAGIEGFRVFIFMSVSYYIGRHMLQIRELRLFRNGMVVVSIMVTIYGIKQFFLMSPIDYRMISLSVVSPTTFLFGGWVRPFSTMSGPFHLGSYLVIVLLLILVLLRYSNTLFRIIIIILFPLQIILLFMTRTKGNWIGFGVGIFVLVFLQSRNSLFAIIRFGCVALFGGVLIFQFFSSVSGIAKEVLNDAVLALKNPMDAPTFTSRVEGWQDKVIPSIELHPIIGYGTGSASDGLRNLYAGTNSLFFNSHNLYLKIWLEIGLFGLIVFLWIVGVSLLKGLRWFFSGRNTSLEAKFLLQWGLPVVITFLVVGFDIPVLDAYPINYYFWLLLGMISKPKMLRGYQ